ncbi:hypothetical protein BAC2_02712 [uncultured bacterium]|nr:hypothetical protein BAC2_02712 [uncultured bacterium]
MPSALTLALLFFTPVGYLPTLSDTYCQSTVVVQALCLNEDWVPGSEQSQSNGAEFRSVRSLKGHLEPGRQVYVISRSFYRQGTQYLLFLRSPTPVEFAGHSQRIASHTPASSTLVLQTTSIAMPIRANAVEIDVSYVVPDRQLLAYSKAEELTKRHEPFRIDPLKLEASFRSVNCQAKGQ